MSKKKLIISYTFLAIFITLATVFFFFDLEISKAMVKDNHNFLYVLIAAIGEFPIYIGPMLCGLVYGFTSEKKWMQLVAHFVGLIFTYVAFIRLSSGVYEYYLDSTFGLLQYVLLTIASLFSYIFFFMIFKKIKQQNLLKMKDIATISLIVSITSIIIVFAMKYIWGRTRYVSLSSDYGEYTNFLTINGFSNSMLGDDNHSFPSGHTASATSILVLGLIPSRFTKKKWINYLVWSICIIYPIVVAISRIGFGQHYASDVLFGFGISISCFLITYLIFKKKGWLYARNDKC